MKDKAYYPEKHRNWSLRSRYGITAQEVDDTVARQEQACAICFRSNIELVVDHDHVNGRFRGMVCRACNLLLGYARDDIMVLDSAVSYLNVNNSRTQSCTGLHCPVMPDVAFAVATIWGEARGESQEGRVAVGEVIRNRTAQRYSSDGRTVASTVLWPWQFSCWNTDAPHRDHMASIDDEDPIVQQCIEAWDTASAGSNVACGAVLYVNLAVAQPHWLANATETVVIGHHHFFVPKAV